MDDKNQELPGQPLLEDEQERMVPDWESECEVCGASPTVTIEVKGMVVSATGLCGACCFGEADCLDPDNW